MSQFQTLSRVGLTADVPEGAEGVQDVAPGGILVQSPLHRSLVTV